MSLKKGSYIAVTMSVTPEQKQAIKDYATRKERTIPWLIRHYGLEYLLRKIALEAEKGENLR